MDDIVQYTKPKPQCAVHESLTMQVADALKSLIVRDLAGINLTATAQYVLADSTVPPEVRTEAVQRPEAGEVITKKEAELNGEEG
jgi:hypothetical protein